MFEKDKRQMRLKRKKERKISKGKKLALWVTGLMTLPTVLLFTSGLYWMFKNITMGDDGDITYKEVLMEWDMWIIVLIITGIFMVIAWGYIYIKWRFKGLGSYEEKKKRMRKHTRAKTSWLPNEQLLMEFTPVLTQELPAVDIDGPIISSYWIPAKKANMFEEMFIQLRTLTSGGSGFKKVKTIKSAKRLIGLSNKNPDAFDEQDMNLITRLRGSLKAKDLARVSNLSTILIKRPKISILFNGEISPKKARKALKWQAKRVEKLKEIGLFEAAQRNQELYKSGKLLEFFIGVGEVKSIIKESKENVKKQDEKFFLKEDKIKKITLKIENAMRKWMIPAESKQTQNGPRVAKPYKDYTTLYFINNDGLHCLYVGSTGSGKTAYLLMPTILAMARSRNKNSLIIGDPKGEIFKKTAGALESEGYEIITLNFRDATNTSTWNPLDYIFRIWSRVFEAKKRIANLTKKQETIIEKMKELWISKGPETFEHVPQEVIDREWTWEQWEELQRTRWEGGSTGFQLFYDFLWSKLDEEYIINISEEPYIKQKMEEIGRNFEEANEVERERGKEVWLKEEGSEKEWEGSSEEERDEILVKYSEWEELKFSEDRWRRIDTYKGTKEFIKKESIVEAQLESRVDEQVGELVGAAIPDEKGSSDSFWVNSAKSVVEGLIWLLFEEAAMTKRYEPKIRDKQINISAVVELLNLPRETLHKYYGVQLQNEVLSGASEETNKRKSYSKLLTYLKMSESTIGSILGVTKAKLAMFENADIRNLTSSSSFEIEQLASGRKALFLVFPEDKLSTYGPLGSIAVKQIYSALSDYYYARGEVRLDPKVHFILDEFANFPKIPDFTSMQTVSRDRGIIFHAALQDYSQLEKTYGREDTKTLLANFNTLSFLLTTQIDTAKSIAEQIGRNEVLVDNMDRDGKVNTTSDVDTLVNPEDLLRMPNMKGIVLTSRRNPLQSSYVPGYFDQYAMAWNNKGKIQLENVVKSREEWQSGYMYRYSLWEEKQERRTLIDKIVTEVARNKDKYNKGEYEIRSLATLSLAQLKEIARDNFNFNTIRNRGNRHPGSKFGGGFGKQSFTKDDKDAKDVETFAETGGIGTATSIFEDITPDDYEGKEVGEYEEDDFS